MLVRIVQESEKERQAEELKRLQAHSLHLKTLIDTNKYENVRTSEHLRGKWSEVLEQVRLRKEVLGIPIAPEDYPSGSSDKRGRGRPRLSRFMFGDVELRSEPPLWPASPHGKVYATPDKLFKPGSDLHEMFLFCLSAPRSYGEIYEYASRIGADCRKWVEHLGKFSTGYYRRQGWAMTRSEVDGTPKIHIHPTWDWNGHKPPDGVKLKERDKYAN
jgi:hypothetical protein